MLSLVVTGCSNSVNDRTDSYGALVYDNPDSLLQIVTSKDTTGLSVFERHEYNLMYTAAMCRTGLCVTDTTDISACEDYFSEKGDVELTALSKLYHAENAYHQFDYYKAVRKCTEALRILQDADNYAVKYNLLNLLYRINSEAGCSELAYAVCRKANEYAEKGGYDNQIAESLNNMAEMFIEQGKMNAAADILYRNHEISDKRILSHYYRIRGLYLLNNDSTESAYQMLRKSEETMPTADTFYDMAQLYLKTGRADSCLNYCHFAVTADRRGYVSMKAYNIIVENFSNMLANNTLIRICTDLNRLYLKRAENADAVKIAAMQTDCYEDEDTNIIPWTAVLIILIISVVLYFKNRKTDAYKDTKLMNEKIVYEFRKLSTQGVSPSQEQWINLHNAANRHIPFFLSRLHKINDLSAREINICLLTRLHFAPSEIAALADISPQSVTNIRSRLLTKIFGVKGGAAEFDRRIKSISN